MQLAERREPPRHLLGTFAHDGRRVVLALARPFGGVQPRVALVLLDAQQRLGLLDLPREGLEARVVGQRSPLQAAELDAVDGRPLRREQRVGAAPAGAADAAHRLFLDEAALRLRARRWRPWEAALQRLLDEGVLLRCPSCLFRRRVARRVPAFARAVLLPQKAAAPGARPGGGVVGDERGASRRPTKVRTLDGVIGRRPDGSDAAAALPKRAGLGLSSVSSSPSHKAPAPAGRERGPSPWEASTRRPTQRWPTRLPRPRRRRRRARPMGPRQPMRPRQRR